jgi:hypothetical protein
MHDNEFWSREGNSIFPVSIQNSTYPFTCFFSTITLKQSIYEASYLLCFTLPAAVTVVVD